MGAKNFFLLILTRVSLNEMIVTVCYEKNRRKRKTFFKNK